MRISDWSSDVCSSDLPLRELAQPTKRTAMGRFNHENVAFMASTDRRVAFYMGDDTTPGCIYKFVPDRAYSDTNRAANTDLLDYGTLYVARFKDRKSTRLNSSH